MTIIDGRRTRYLNPCMFLIHSLFSVSSKALFFSFSSLISLSVIQIYTHFECLILIFKFLGLPLPFVKFT